MEKLIKSKITTLIVILAIVVLFVISYFISIEATKSQVESMEGADFILMFALVGGVIGGAISIGVDYLVHLLVLKTVTKNKLQSKLSLFNLVGIVTICTYIFAIILSVTGLVEYNWASLINPIYFLGLYLIYYYYTEYEEYDRKKVLTYLGIIYAIKVVLQLGLMAMASMATTLPMA